MLPVRNVAYLRSFVQTESMMLSTLAGNPLVGLHGDLLRMMDNSVYLEGGNKFCTV